MSRRLILPGERRRILSPLDPRDVPGLMAGGIWLPGVGVSSLGGGSSRWASQSSNTGDDYDFKDSHDGYKPAATTASNGAAIWDLPRSGGTTASWCINTGASPRPPGAGLQFTQRGSFAVWLKSNLLDTNTRVIFSMWPGGVTGNRLFVHKNNDLHRLALYVSNDGSAADTGTPLSRAKWNSGSSPGLGPALGWDGWHFLRVFVDMTGSNYLDGGAKFSTRVRVYWDEEELANDPVSGCGSYSAGSPPVDGGPIAAIATGATRCSLGADFVSSQWNGQLGPCYISNEDATAPITDEQWARIMLYNAPA